MKVLVGLSGGVDSAVCALLLKEMGHEVIGTTMSIWGKKGFSGKITPGKNACLGPDEAEDIEEAKKICNEIGIPHYVFDCESVYSEIVLDNFKKEYLNGRTPNPCVWCNALIKFQALPDMARAAGIEFDKFATGHYASIKEKDGRYYLHCPKDIKKDQTYFLYRLKEEKLKNLLLPLGDLTKDQTREIARKYGLHVAEKGDSQDFYSGDYNDLLNTKEAPGNIVNTEGKILGTHKGFWNYTIGQRKGLNVPSNVPMYVLSLNKDKNEVVVGPVDKTFKKTILAGDLSWVNDPPAPGLTGVSAKIRSASKRADVKISYEDGMLKAEFEEFQKSPAIGQSIVLYKDDTVLGGGIIEKIS